MGLLGWAAIAVWTIVLLAAGEVVRSFVTRLIDDRRKALESRFAGSRWAHRRAIRRYRAEVTERLAHVPAPFKLRVRLSMEQLYMRLGSTEAPEGPAHVVDLDLAALERPRALVLGPPGSGKSLFLLHTHWMACRDTDEAPLTALVPLARLADSQDVVAEVAAAFGRYGFANAGAFVTRELDRSPSHLLLLFDGLDEVASDARAQVANLLTDFAHQYPHVRFIVTCRTQVYEGALDGIVDRCLYVQPFTDELVERFLHAWPDMGSDEAVDRLIDVLQHTPRLGRLVQNPLLLTMLAHLYSSEYNESTKHLPRTRTDFYREVSELLLDRWQRQLNSFHWVDKKVVLQHLALVNQDSRADRRGIRYEDVLREMKAVMPRVDLAPEDAKKLLDEIVDRSGLLTRLDSGEYYQFAHLTMQEYFAAISLLDRPDEILRRYDDDPQAWREPLKLWCGGDQDSTAVIGGIAETDKVLAVECLADATNVDDTYADMLVETAKNTFTAMARPSTAQDDLARAMGVLASDRRPRGRAVLAWLSDPDAAAYSSGYGASHGRERRRAIALAASHMPEAAEALARSACWSPDLMPHLTGMGDIAVPALEALVDSGRSGAALGGLADIGTPRAARRLAQFLWHPSDALVSRLLSTQELAGVRHRYEEIGERLRQWRKPGRAYYDLASAIGERTKASLRQLLSDRSRLTQVLQRDAIGERQNGMGESDVPADWDRVMADRDTLASCFPRPDELRALVQKDIAKEPTGKLREDERLLAGVLASQPILKGVLEQHRATAIEAARGLKRCLDSSSVDLALRDVDLPGYVTLVPDGAVPDDVSVDELRVRRILGRLNTLLDGLPKPISPPPVRPRPALPPPLGVAPPYRVGPPRRRRVPSGLDRPAPVVGPE